MTLTHVDDEPDEVRVSVVADYDFVVLVVFRVRNHTQLAHGCLRPLRQRRPTSVIITSIDVFRERRLRQGRCIAAVKRGGSLSRVRIYRIKPNISYSYQWKSDPDTDSFRINTKI